MDRRRIVCALACLALLLVAAPGMAAVVPWAHNPSGSNVRFGWTTGQHESFTGGTAHGSPLVDKYGFIFNDYYGDMNFRAEYGGSPQSINASVSVRINTTNSTPSGAPPLDKITVVEFGTWGGVASALNVQADFDITDLVSFANTGAIQLPVPTFYPDGTWMIQQTFTPGPGNPLGSPWTDPNILRNFKVRVRNLIAAGGDTGQPGTFIEKTGLYIYPEPSSLVLFAAALPLLWRRIRR